MIPHKSLSQIQNVHIRLNMLDCDLHEIRNDTDVFIVVAVLYDDLHKVHL